MYILLLVFAMSRGAATATVEFSSQAKCVAAATEIIAKKPYGLEHAFCLAK